MRDVHSASDRTETTVQRSSCGGPTAGSSYSVDLSDGGIGTICGNTIEKGPQTQNENIVHFAGEGTYPNSSLLMCDNTIINDRGLAFGLLDQSGR